MKKGRFIKALVLLVVLLAILTMLAVVIFIAVGQASEFSGTGLITGYEPGEFAVKAEIEKQIDELVAKIIKEGEGKELQLAVIGSADTKGKPAANDQIARQRAEQVANVLAYKFPQAKISIWSKGDEQNIRQVMVCYRFVEIVPAESKPLPAPLSPREGINLLWLLAVIVVSILAILLALHNKSRIKKSKVEKVVSDIIIEGYKISSALGILGEKYEEEKKIICPFCTKEIITKNFRRHILNRCQMITQEERSLIEKRLKGGLENDNKEA